MKADAFFSGVVSPLSLAAYLAICAGSLIAYAGLRKRWQQPGSARSTRSKDLAALALVFLSALLSVFVGGLYLDRRVAEAKMVAEVQDRTAVAARLRKQIADELEAVRETLIDRTQRKIADGKLAEARAELARFAPLQDPQIAKVVALLDKELEIRKLLEQSGSETAPQRLAAIYSRLSDLVPDSTAYKQHAARYAAAAK